VTRYTARPATLADAEGLAALFTAASCPCYCRYFHFPGDKNAWLERCALAPDENRRELERALASRADDGRGLVAVGPSEQIVGWAKLAPASSVPKAYAQRYYAGLACLQGDRDGIYFLGCMLVAPAHRRRGAARTLAREAVALAARSGASAVEALPRVSDGPVADEELWTCPLAALREAGFVVVGGDPAYPVVRATLASRGAAR
jgi:GNAT superfamily N-acetyltransferase